MIPIIFDGKAFAKEKELELKAKIKESKKTPKIISILVGKDPASILYTKLKQKAAKRVGAKFLIHKLKDSVEPQVIIDLIQKCNNDNSIDGIMVQLPLPEKLKSKTNTILKTIAKGKDVDGLTKNSPFIPAAVRAVREIVKYATKDLPYFGKKAAVIGASGMVGKGVVKELQKIGYKVTECDINTRDFYQKLTGVDLIVSATGVAGLVKGEMIKEGVIAVDVGAPRGDFDKKVFKKVSFITPVPGGVGPVTIACLLENLTEAVYNSR